MKILQIGSHYDHGGAARVMACIHRELLKKGETSFVAYGRGKKVSEENVMRIDTTPEIYISALCSRIFGLNGWGNFLATDRLIRFMKKNRPDVVHMHTLHGYYLNMPRLFKYLNKEQIPWVWTFHDCHAFVGNCGYYYDCEKWKEGCGNCPYLGQYPTSQFFDFTSYMWKKKKELFTQSKKSVIITPSDWLTEEAKKSFVGIYPCKTIRNGIDVHNTFTPRGKEVCREKYGYDKEEKIVLGIAVGYSDPRKGAKYIIQMAKDLAKEVKVILIGWDEKNNELLQDTSNIITLPATESADMLAEYYSLADVFVLPSLAENYATVTIESMACGTPVVGFMAGGIPEQLTDRKGIAVPTADQKAFNEAVRAAVLEDSDLLRGEALAELIKKENSVEKMTTEYLKVYKELINE